MSGKLNILRGNAAAIRAANMKDEGYTSRQIAAAIGKRPEQIKALVLLGQRIRVADLREACLAEVRK